MPIDGSIGCRGLAEAAVVGHLAAVGEQEIDPLGAVHRAAAADGDDESSRTVLPGERTRRAATMMLSGFSAKSENGTTASDAASSERCSAAA